MHTIGNVFVLVVLALFVMFAGCSTEENHGRKTEPAREVITKEPRELMWHLFGKNGINIEPAWAITKGSKAITLAVIDSGFLPNSPAFRDCSSNYKLLEFVRAQYSQGFHGAAVASLLSTCPGNPLGLIGINNFSPVIWIERGEEPNAVIDLLDWAIKDFDCVDKSRINCAAPISTPVDVINASIETKPSPGRRDVLHALLLSFSQVAKQKGTLIVAAAGNESKNADKIFPHSLSGILSAGATTKDGVSWRHSNWGNTVDGMLPGDDIAVVGETGVAIASGTSASSPILAGVVSLMKSVYPDINWKTAIYFIQSTAVPMDCDAYCVGRSACLQDCCINGVQVCTPGRVDAHAAVAAAKNASINGLPPVALIDSDSFIIKLVQTNTGTFGPFTVRNVGGRGGRYHLSSDNPNVMVAPAVIDLDQKGGPLDHREITLTSNQQEPGWTNITIKSPESGNVATYSDEIVVGAHTWKF